MSKNNETIEEMTMDAAIELAEAIRLEETPEGVADKVEYFCCPFEAAVDEAEDAEKLRRAKCALHGDACGRCIAAWLSEEYRKEADA